jgi:NAD-dependent deacetylase
VVPIENLIEEAATLLVQSEHAVGLTGAGVSTPSGIPDFRSAESGLWQLSDPMKVASIGGFRAHPQSYYDWARPLTRKILRAIPNAAHIALASMEQQGPIKCVITQNIDDLHNKAGSSNILEVHGHMREMTCINCHAILEAEPLLEAFIESGTVPLCPACEGVLKPNVIFLGELLPLQILNQAKWQSKTCDVMLVAGTSLEVTPVSELPVLAKREGARLIIVNLDETRLDYLADVVIHADVVDVLPQLAAPFART